MRGANDHPFDLIKRAMVAASDAPAAIAQRLAARSMLKGRQERSTQGFRRQIDCVSQTPKLDGVQLRRYPFIWIDTRPHQSCDSVPWKPISRRKLPQDRNYGLVRLEPFPVEYVPERGR
jgi:hypothetical protein